LALGSQLLWLARRSPCPRQEFVEAVIRPQIDETGEHVGKIGLGVDAVQFASLDPRTLTIIAILREHEAGVKTADICRKHGVSSATFFKWKAKFGGLEVSDARRLKTLEDENRKLKKLLAEAMLDNAMLKDINSKKW
jgi:putative transposase